jgi:hypothetical protein
VYFYKRFIDNVIGVWFVHPDPSHNQQLWDGFCADMNGWHGLEWECTTPSTSITISDLTITIADGNLETTLYEKSENLVLYIPPHTQVLRIRRLCSKSIDADKNSMNSSLA